MADEIILGDVFWDLPTWVYYTANYDLGCTIYVANPTDVAKEYCLMTRTYRNNAQRGEGVLQVYGYSWFTVEPGDFITLRGTMKNTESDVLFTVDLFEKETQASADTISTFLVTPSASAMPPGWGGGTIGGGTDILSMMMMIMVMTMMVKMVSSAIGPEKEEKKKELT